MIQVIFSKKNPDRKKSSKKLVILMHM